MESFIALNLNIQANKKVDCSDEVQKKIDNIDKISVKVNNFPDILPHDRNEKKEEKRKIINKWKYFVVDGKNVVDCWDVDVMVTNQTFF